MLNELPPAQAEVFALEKNCIKEFTELERAEFQDANRRYDMVGGERKEWVEYLRSSVADQLWDYIPDGEECGRCAVLAVPRTKDELLRKILAIIPFNLATRSIPELFGEVDADMGMHGGALLALFMMRCTGREQMKRKRSLRSKLHNGCGSGAPDRGSGLMRLMRVNGPEGLSPHPSCVLCTRGCAWEGC